MGMGYAAVEDIEIEKSVVKNITKESFSDLEKALDKFNISLNDFARAMVFDHQDELELAIADVDKNVLKSDKRLMEAFNEADEGDDFANYLLVVYNFLSDCFDKVAMEFKEKTDGIVIDLAYHDAEEHGDRYDEVEEAYFSARHETIFKETNSVKKLRELGGNYQRVRFVQLG